MKRNKRLKKMPEWKEIHLAKNMADLRYYSTGKINWEVMKTRTEKSLVKTLEKIHDSYLEHKKQRDLELSYVYLYKFFEIFSFLQKHSTDARYVECMFCKQVNSMKDLEAFDKLLRSRYHELEKESEVKTNGIDLRRESNDILLDNQIKKDPETQKKTKSKIEGSKENFSDGFIDCKQLRELIYSSGPSTVLIMDVRSEEEFQSKVKSENIINIPTNIIKPGVSAAQLELKLPELSKSLWKRREQFEYIVLLDSNTNKYTLSKGTPIYSMREILTLWDYPIKYKNPPLILDEGFNAWLETYPNDTVNPVLFKALKSSSAKPTTVSLSSIEYPDSDEESKKENGIKSEVNSVVSVPSQIVTDTVSQPHLPMIPSATIPHFDRSSKPKLENKTIVDKINPRKPSQSIHDSSNVNNEIEKPVENNPVADHSDEDKKPPIQQLSPKPDSISHNKENFSSANSNNASSKEDWKIDSEIKYVGLKSDTDIIAGSPSLKKSLSSPNISKLDDNMEVLIPKATPLFDRSNKPNYLTKIDSPRHGYQEKQYRLSSQGELEGAVMGANIVRGLTGLKNLGNSCYMNSILQCISNTAVLRHELCRFNASENLKNKSKTEGLIAREIQKVIRILWSGNIKYFSCIDLKSVVGKFRNSFKGSEQQDSHEFFTILMDWLHEDLNEPSPSGELLGAVEGTGEKAWGEFRRNNNSIVLDLFYGQQKSTVRCKECGKQSVTFEPFSNLSLLLPSSEDSCTLYDCLNLYLKEEFISGWNCPKCKSPQSATKKVDITRLPPVLVIHFKRFTSNGWCRKKQTYVNFPVNPLDMREYTAKGSEQRNEFYSLYAVSNHYGTMESGHYTAYCLNTELNRWYKFDDQDVSDISVNDVKTSAAYILFYSVKR